MKKKLLAILLTVAALVVMSVPFQAFAENDSVTIYFKNTGNWEEVYGYTWYGAGSTGQGWPGTQMTDAGDGWFKMVYEGTKPLNVIFNNNGKPSNAQTGNHTPADLSLDKNTYWFVPSSETADSGDGMSSGLVVTIYDTAQDGFPAAQAEQASTDSAEQTTTPPTTGVENNAYIILVLSLITISGVCILKKKSNNL